MVEGGRKGKKKERKGGTEGERKEKQSLKTNRP